MASESLVPKPCTGPEGSSGLDYRRVASAGDSPRHVGRNKKKETKNERLLFPINPIAVNFVIHRGSQPEH